MIADGGLGADAQGHAKHLVASIHVFEQVVGGDDVRQYHDKGGGARLGQPQVTAEDRHRALAVALEQVADGEGPGQHDADVASDLDGAEQLFLVGEHRVEAPAAEDLGEDSGEVLDDGKRQGHLDERVHHLAEYQEPGDHRRRPVLQAGGQQEAEDEQRRQQVEVFEGGLHDSHDGPRIAGRGCRDDAGCMPATLRCCPISLESAIQANV